MWIMWKIFLKFNTFLLYERTKGEKISEMWAENKIAKVIRGLGSLQQYYGTFNA